MKAEIKDECAKWKIYQKKLTTEQAACAVKRESSSEKMVRLLQKMESAINVTPAALAFSSSAFMSLTPMASAT